MEEEETIEIYTPEQIRLLIKAIGWIRKDIEKDGTKQTLWVQMGPLERLKYQKVYDLLSSITRLLILLGFTLN